MYRIGTAGWSIPRACAGDVPGEGTHLQRYSATFNAAEINSSFHRPHAEATYRRWADATPAGFLFSVKMPRTITHNLKLRRARAPLEQFLRESSALGGKRGPILIQLPPSFTFDRRVVGRFLELLRTLHAGPLVCEPRHATWFTAAVDGFLSGFEVARVAADPVRAADADRPGGWPGIVYYRLHGSPRPYWSRYEPEYVSSLAARMAPGAWCIFDNTAAGAALPNALEMTSALYWR